LFQVAHSISIPAKALACLTGKIILMFTALGPVARLMTSAMCALLNSTQVFQLSEDALNFWSTEIHWFNGQDIWVGLSVLKVVYTDASDNSYAGYAVQHRCHIAQGLWSPGDSARSSTWKKIKTVRMVFEALESKLADGLQIVKMWFEF